MNQRRKIRLKRDNESNQWLRCESFCTTKQFQEINGRRYRRHCGPTAVTNLILTLKMKEHASIYRDESFQKRTFLQMAHLGERMKIYVNGNLPGGLGGTSDLLLPFYLRKAMEKSRCRARILGRRPLTEGAVKAALARGSLLYVELFAHPRYGNHHVICYSAGSVVVSPRDLPQRKPRFYYRKVSDRVVFQLRCADGWSKRPVYLSLDHIMGTFVEIGIL